MLQYFTNSSPKHSRPTLSAAYLEARVAREVRVVDRRQTAQVTCRSRRQPSSNFENATNPHTAIGVFLEENEMTSKIDRRDRPRAVGSLAKTGLMLVRRSTSLLSFFSFVPSSNRIGKEASRMSCIIRNPYPVHPVTRVCRLRPRTLDTNAVFA